LTAIMPPSVRTPARSASGAGVFVLRFLAEDVGKELDLVLDTVLRSLSRKTAAVPPNRIITLWRRRQG
jgi:hypothetical protein